MPEGPEVRITADQLQGLIGQKLINTTLNQAKCSGFELLTYPRTIDSVYSWGKKIIFESQGLYIITSLIMTGRYTFDQSQYARICFEFQDFNLYFDDKRKMGFIDVVDTLDLDVGPDLLEHALNEWISAEEWNNIFRKKLLKRKIVDILLDQKIVAGIGFYLVTDILYYSGIHPFRIGNTITDEELELLRVKSHEVIALSYSYGGLTIEDFISPDKERGEYPTAIYMRSKDDLGYDVLRAEYTGKRKIWYVAEVQAL